jgi:hypothetical protein
MADTAWIALTSKERSMLTDALAALSGSAIHDKAEIEAMAAKLQPADPYPQITVGVHGGLVQWTLGNPFPIRICDYDGCDAELPDVDERGQRCSMWFEPAEIAADSSQFTERNR